MCEGLLISREGRVGVAVGVATGVPEGGALSVAFVLLSWAGCASCVPK